MIRLDWHSDIKFDVEYKHPTEGWVNIGGGTIDDWKITGIARYGFGATLHQVLEDISAETEKGP